MMISIIANFYKSERYISKLIESVLRQTYSDWELICINDCSPGNDLNILKRYAKRDSRIRIVNNEINLGISKAKFRGIQEAKGKYLCFIDGDDWLEPEALQRMIEPALKFDIDMVVMNHRKVLPILGYSHVYRSKADKWNVPIDLDPFADSSHESRLNFVNYYGHFFGSYKFNTAYWGKLIKKEVIIRSGFTPPTEQVGEDFYFGYKIFPFIKRLMFIDYVGYNWRWGGMTSGKKNSLWTGEKNILRSNAIYEERLELIKKYNLQCYRLSLMVEQRNNFVGFIGAEAKYPPNSESGKNIIKFLSEVLSAKFYEDFSLLQESDSYYANDELTTCLINKDAMGVYVFCHKTYLSSIKKRFMKRFIHRLLYPFAKL